MNEKANNLPQSYLEEAETLKQEYLVKLKLHMDVVVKQGAKGRDFGAREEKKLQNEFFNKLMELKQKYNIT